MIHTLLFACLIVFFAMCLVGAIGWCLSRAVASIPVRVWVALTRAIPGMHGDPWPGWHQTHDPDWVNEISQPMPAITGEVIPPRSLDIKVRDTLDRARRVEEETATMLAVSND